MRYVPLLLLLVTSAAALAACGGSDPVEPGGCFIDESRFRDLAVSGETPPRFTWCGAPAKVLLVSIPARNSVWRVECTGQIPLCINPGVTYGIPPGNTTQTLGPLPLQAGALYEFCLFGVEERPPTACSQFQR